MDFVVLCLKLGWKYVIVGKRGSLKPCFAKGMGVDLKRMIAAVIVLIMLMCMVTVSASTPGTTTEPLITLSYLEGTFAASLRTEVSGALGRAETMAMSRFDEIYKAYIGYRFAPRFTHVSLAVGDMVELTTGSSFILLSGSAALTVVSGTVINVSTGSEVASGTQLTLNHRYFCAESTTAQVTAGTAATGHIDGVYLLDGGQVTTPPPPPPPPQELPFTDVRASDWFFAAVEFAFTNELFRGTTATTFSPGASMTRAMFVTVLWRLDGQPAASAGGGFSDVRNPSLYYYEPVAWASANNIVNGYADGSFRPDLAITREQIATIMHRYAAFKGRDMSSSGAAYDAFPDRGSVSEFAVEPMRWAVSWGVISGSDGRLVPRNTATRAQVAQIVFNYSQRVGA
jgi:hypothetical protein